MPGFGHEPFGHTPFGEADWGTLAFWDVLPQYHRDSDPDFNDTFRKFWDSVSGAFNLTRRQIREFTDLRDARKIRTRYQDNAVVTLNASTQVSSMDSDDGSAYLILDVTGTLTDIAPGWFLVTETQNYVVKAIRKLDSEVDVYGDEEPTGTLTFRPPSLIEFLADDFDVAVDGNLQEFLQRSSVHDAIKVYDLKGTENGIEYVAQLSGFTTIVQELWSIESDWSGELPAGSVFEIPLSSGNWYTSVAPDFFLFDDVAADYVPADTQCSQSSHSWALTLDTVTGSAGAYTLTFDGGDDLEMVATVGRWYITEDADPETRYYLESVTPATPAATVATQTSPPTGAYTLYYDCPVGSECWYCRSHKLRIVVRPSDPSTIGDDDAFLRLVGRIERSLPAHCTVAEYHRIEPLTGSSGLDLGVTGFFQYIEGSSDLSLDVTGVFT